VATIHQAPAAEYNLKFGYYIQAEASFGIGNDKWSRLVEKLSNGRVKITNYPGGSIASEHKAVALVKAGTLHLAQATTQNMGQFTDIYRPFDVFYTVPSAEAAVRLFEQSKTGKEIDDHLRKTHGLKTLYYIPMVGYRKIWNNKQPVKIPADLKGLKLRSTATPIEQHGLKALGANPVPLPYPEIYMALQQKMINGLHVDTETVIHAKQYEVLDYGTAVDAQHAFEVTVISDKLWNSFPPDIQQAFLDASVLTFWDRIRVAVQQVKSDEEAIAKKGVEVYHPTAAEMNQWKTDAKTVEKKLIDEGVLKIDWFNRIRNELAEMQKRCIIK
jgi:TRAP-type C4-dicarboxylate transport system substrate-binding protein